MADNQDIIATAIHDQRIEEPASAMLGRRAYPQCVASRPGSQLNRVSLRAHVRRSKHAREA
jgi:hypothetical protein